MSADSKPRSIAERFWGASLKVFGGVVLLLLTLDLLAEVWPVLVVVGLATAAVAATVWWRRRW